MSEVPWNVPVMYVTAWWPVHWQTVRWHLSSLSVICPLLVVCTSLQGSRWRCHLKHSKASGDGPSSICLIWFIKGPVVSFLWMVRPDAHWFTCKFPIRIDPCLAPPWHLRGHGAGPKSQQVDWSCKSMLNLMLNLGLEVGTPCPQKPRQPGCGRGGPLWAPSLWGTSWRTCFISDHTLCFLQCILFHRLLKRGEPAFKMILAFCHAKLN